MSENGREGHIMEETKKKLYVEPDGFWTEASILFMALAIVFRLIGSIGRWDELPYLVTLVALYLGYRLWGVLGMLLAPLVTATAIRLSSLSAE